MCWSCKSSIQCMFGHFEDESVKEGMGRCWLLAMILQDNKSHHRVTGLPRAHCPLATSSGSSDRKQYVVKRTGSYYKLRAPCLWGAFEEKDGRERGDESWLGREDGLQQLRTSWLLLFLLAILQDSKRVEKRLFKRWRKKMSDEGNIEKSKWQ